MTYDEMFDGYEVPVYLKSMAITICKRFCIKGLSDGMYIANVIANQNGMGNGAGDFNGKNNYVDRKTAEFLQVQYSTLIMADEVEELHSIMIGQIDVWIYKRGLERAIKRFRAEKKSCIRNGNNWDNWRVEYLNKRIKQARESLEDLLGGIV